MFILLYFVNFPDIIRTLRRRDARNWLASTDKTENTQRKSSWYLGDLQRQRGYTKPRMIEGDATGVSHQHDLQLLSRGHGWETRRVYMQNNHSLNNGDIFVKWFSVNFTFILPIYNMKSICKWEGPWFPKEMCLSQVLGRRCKSSKWFHVLPIKIESLSVPGLSDTGLYNVIQQLSM